MKKLTIFTPSYNRAFCLGNCYNSLLRQTIKDFKWLIIDDGSSDETRELVASWIKENRIEINYVFQENQGMHGAHNTAYKNIDTELNVCIDSDDFMSDNAVEKIIDLWNSKGADKYAGIIGLDALKDGTILGEIPSEIKESTLSDIYSKYKIEGDKKLVLRTDVVKNFPEYPVYKDERLVPLGTLYLMIDQQYTFLCTNDIYCIVEYLPGGSSNTILKQYKQSPQGFLYARTLQMKYSKSFKYTATRAIHYISSCLFLRKWNFLKGNPKKMITIMSLPFGVLFHLYILFKIRK